MRMERAGPTLEVADRVTYDARSFRRELRAAIHEAIEMARPDKGTKKDGVGDLSGVSIINRRDGDGRVMTSWLLPPKDMGSFEISVSTTGSLDPRSSLLPERSVGEGTGAVRTETTPEAVIPELGTVDATPPATTPSADTAGYFGSLSSSLAGALGLASSETMKNPGINLMAPFSSSSSSTTTTTPPAAAEVTALTIPATAAVGVLCQRSGMQCMKRDTSNTKLSTKAA